MTLWDDYCNPIQDQGNCGSCTAFGITGIAELRAFIKYGVLPKLSEKDLFACSGGTCARGNTMEAAFARAMRGIPVYECCPYVDKDTMCGEGRCENWWENAIKILNPTKLETNKEIDNAIDEGGAVATLAVYESFTHYKKRIYTGPTGPYDPLVGYHCIGITGMDIDNNADRIRNSWNTTWGEEGKGWITRGICGLKYYVFDVSNDVEPDEEPDGFEYNPALIAIIIIIIIAIIAYAVTR